ncbi:MAG: DUF881 domain-containing protein [Peptococcaceae bacterium]|nr:DUF881 domain-containing protein [Peptococcaceae bacterium]
MKSRARFALALVSLFIGLLLAVQIRSTGNFTATVPDLRTSEMRVLLMDAIRQNQELQEDIDELRGHLHQYEGALTQGEGALELLRADLDKARILAGMADVEGPGLVVTMIDSRKVATQGEDPSVFIVHDEDILKLTNALFAAGAEAISVNDQRLLATSEIHCAGPSISINNTRIAAPFVITAIGDPDVMESSLRMRGGIMETLTYFGIDVSIKRLSTVSVPGYSRMIRFEWAKPVKGGK